MVAKYVSKEQCFSEIVLSTYNNSYWAAWCKSKKSLLIFRWQCKITTERRICNWQEHARMFKLIALSREYNIKKQNTHVWENTQIHKIQNTHILYKKNTICKRRFETIAIQFMDLFNIKKKMSKKNCFCRELVNYSVNF